MLIKLLNCIEATIQMQPLSLVSRSLCESLALALLNALELATEADSSSAALPLLIAVHRMALDEEKIIAQAMRERESLIPLMTDWLPRATQPMAIPTAKASGLSAACTLRLLSDAGATLDGALAVYRRLWRVCESFMEPILIISDLWPRGSELAPLIRCGTSVLAEAKSDS